MNWIDVHNHLHDSRLGGDEKSLIDEMVTAGVGWCVVNATCQSDWEQVAKLADVYPDFILPAFGVHPWKAGEVSGDWIDRMAILLEKFPKASVGEIGLDQWVDDPVIEVQREVFSQQLRVAREYGRPVTIHCLKAWQPLFDVFEDEPPPNGFLMHSFGGSIEVAERLIPLGAYFSFSGYFLNERKAKVVEVFRQLPRDRILVETDAPDMSPPACYVDHPLGDQNHPANLSGIAKALSEKLGMEPNELAEITSANARCLFGAPDGS